MTVEITDEASLHTSLRLGLSCHWLNTRLSFLLRNVAPENMATSSEDLAHKCPAYVDQKIVNEVLSAATGDIAKPSCRGRVLKDLGIPIVIAVFLVLAPRFVLARLKSLVVGR